MVTTAGRGRQERQRGSRARQRGSRAGLAIAVALTTVVGLVVVVRAPLPAGAISVATTYTQVTPVTWVDGQGRQYEVVSTAPAGLAIARANPNGTPDAAWGTASPASGVRTVAIDPPAASGITLEGALAATDDGILTTTWRPSGCSAANACDRWFARYDGATGATVGTPTLVAAAPPTVRALRDGSLIVGTSASALAWRGPDGTLRPVPAISAADLVGADVDPDGRLLVATSDGTLRRIGATGSADLEIGTGCAAQPVAVGAAADGGFATACFAGSPAALTVTRRHADGTLSWTSTGTATGLPIATPSRLAIDSLDRAWVGGAASPALWPGIATPPVTVAAFGASGPIATGRSRATSGGGTGDALWWSDMGGGIVDLRPIGDGSEVAFADLRVCCRYPSNTSPAMAAYGGILPGRPSPPVCDEPMAVPRSTAPGAATVSFAPCGTVVATQAATSYRVVAAWGTGSTEATVPATDAPTASLTGLPHGRRIGFEVVPANEQGTTVGTATEAFTVLPFPNLDDFVHWSVDHLSERELTLTQLDALAAQVRSGDRTAAETMTEVLTAGLVVPRVEPVVRLYLAAFLRDPDTGGLDYWVRQRRAGVRLVDVAERFARSSEFVRRYGALSNQAFVELVYRNVLGRTGDRAGISYWTAKLTNGTSRGTVLAQVSESSEHVMRSAPVVKPIVVAYAMLGRRPTAAERADWIDDPDAYASVPVSILGSQAFLDRWFSPTPGP